MIDAIECREGWKKSKQRLEATRFQLTMLKQVHRSRSGGGSKRRDHNEAQRNVREQPHASHALRGAPRRESYEIRADRGNGGQRSGNERQADVARQYFDDEQRQREDEAGERQRWSEARQRDGARPQ